MKYTRAITILSTTGDYGIKRKLSPRGTKDIIDVNPAYTISTLSNDLVMRVTANSYFAFAIVISMPSRSALLIPM